MAQELGLSLLQLGVVISSLLFAAADRCPGRRDHLRRHRASEDDPDARGAVLRRRPVCRVLTGRTRAGHLLADRVRCPGDRPHHARARGRWRLDGGPGLPRGAGALRDPRIDHRAQRVGHRRRSARPPSWCNAILGDPLGPRGRRLALHVRGLRAARRRAVLRHAADAGVAALAGREGHARRSARGAEDRAFRGPRHRRTRSGGAHRRGGAGGPPVIGSSAIMGSKWLRAHHPRRHRGRA